MRCKFSKCFSILFAGVFIFNTLMPMGSIQADEFTDSTEIGIENEMNVETNSSVAVASNGQYSSTVDSVPDRWTVGDVIQYSCSAPAGATVTWSVTVSGVVSVTNTGLVTALKQGYTILKAEWMNGTTPNSMSTQVYVGTIPDGTYFIGNRETGKYIDLEDSGTADGTNIQQWDFHGDVQSQWNITLDQHGYYMIQSVCTGKYIGVENSSSSIHAKIKQYSFHRTSPGIRWLITPTASGAYKFTCQAAEDTNMVMIVPSSGSTANGTDLKQYPYANNAVYRDEWVIVQEIGSASFLAIPEEDGRDRTSSFANAGQSVSAMGYANVMKYMDQDAVAVTATDCIEMIASSDIFYVRTHGAQHSISLSQGNLNSTAIAILADDALSECKLVLYGTCNTGKYREAQPNLVNNTHEQGVVTVIGFDNPVGCNEMNAWAVAFFDALVDGTTVIEACAYADNVIQTSGLYSNLSTVEHSYIAGFSAQVLLNTEITGGN